MAALLMVPALHVQAEFAAPANTMQLSATSLLPLKDAFADAASVKRAMEYRSRAVALERR
jgi:hypothetical protein